MDFLRCGVRVALSAARGVQKLRGAEGVGQDRPLAPWTHPPPDLDPDSFRLGGGVGQLRHARHLLICASTSLMLLSSSPTMSSICSAVDTSAGPNASQCGSK